MIFLTATLSLCHMFDQLPKDLYLLSALCCSLPLLCCSWFFFRACIKNRGQSSMEATSFEKKKSVQPITFTARWTLCTGSANQKRIRLNLHSAIFANLLFTSLHLFPLSMVQSLSCLPSVSHLASLPCALNLFCHSAFQSSHLHLILGRQRTLCKSTPSASPPPPASRLLPWLTLQ